MSFNYASIGGLGGAENPGGIAQRLLFAPTSYFTTIEEPENMSTATTAAELTEVTANHVFVATKFFHTLYCTQGKGKGSFKNAAEVDASGGFYEAEFFVPGVDAATQGLLRKMKADEHVFLLPMADGVNHQMGTTNFPAKLMEYEFGTAENGSGVRGTTIKLRSFQMGPITYSGTAPTS